MPDLFVDSLEVLPPTQTGGNYTLTAFISNYGPNPAENVSVRFARKPQDMAATLRLLDQVGKG